jgi:hypothetical protein
LAEEVDIGNVGGDGVASEVTLAKLTTAIENMARASGVDPRSAAAKLQEQYNKSLGETDDITQKYTDSLKDTNKETKKTTNRIKKLGQASMNAVGGLLGSVAGGFTGLAKEFVNGGNNLSDFAQHIPIVGGLLGGFAGYIDNTVSTFRTLSATGAAFGNDMMETRRSAAQMGLSLDEFAGLITNNAGNLAALGGSVTLGAERFKKMNDNIKKSGDFAALKNMGFTVEEVNEGMGDYIDLQRRMGTLQGKSTAELASGSADYLRQIDLLAKVTGKTREEAEKALREQAADAAIRGMMNQFEEGSQELANFRASLGIIDEVGGAAGAAMKDLLDGMPSGPETAQFLNMMGDAGPAMQNALKQIGDGADPQVLLDAMKSGGGELEKFANMDADARAQYIASLRDQQPAMAEFLDTATRMVDIGGRDLDAAKKEQDARDKTTDAFTTFEDAIRAARGIIQEAFVNSGIFEAAGTMVKDFSTTIAGIVEDGTLEATMNSFFDSIKGFVDNFKKFGLGTALFGGEEEIDTPDGKKTVQVKGLLGDLFGEGGTISKAFGDSGNIVLEGITAAAKGFADGMFDFEIPWGTLFIGGLVGIGAAIAAPVLAIPAGIAAAVVAVFGIEFMKDLFSDVWATITGIFSMDTVYAISDLTSAMWTTVTGWFGFGEGEATFAISQLASEAWSTVKGWFTFGEGESFSISEVGKRVWTTVTSWFGFGEGEATYAISTLISEAWTKITGFFDFGEEGFSISALATKAWETVKGFFTWQADTIGLGISILATNAWETVKGFFAWGEEATGFSISGLLTTAWETVTGMFSFGELAIPSISSMFQGIIDKVKGFFTFDFEMPNFKQYLPKWLGGEGKSFFGADSNETAAVETPEAPDPASLDPTQAQIGLSALQETQSVVQSFASIPDLQNNLETLKKGLDINGVRTYTSAMESLVEVLGKLNDELAKDNKFGAGKGTNAGDVVAKMDSIGGGSSNSDQLNATMGSVLAVLSEIRDIELGVQRNTKNLANGNIATSSVSVLPG